MIEMLFDILLLKRILYSRNLVLSQKRSLYSRNLVPHFSNNTVFANHAQLSFSTVKSVSSQIHSIYPNFIEMHLLTHVFLSQV